MAQNTDIHLQNQTIYSIFVRNHTPEGTFRAVIPDLDRIKALGTDIIWLMPIHPLGVKGRKGSLGSPYACRDYRSVNPEYGTMEDFTALVDAIHARGMKCIIDVVYNHTSPDSLLYTEHPEYFCRDENGKPGNKIGDWSDVIDLDYSAKGLWDYQIESLCMWAKYVDGFRCDVASFVPLEFWKAARRAVEAVHPGCIWLAESVHLDFGIYARRRGIYSMLDYEGYEAFDMEYDYDLRRVFDDYLKGKRNLSHYIELLNFQEGCYPVNYNKLRSIENHDQPRICSFVEGEAARRSFTALMYFLKGTTLIYAGQEFENEHCPSLFDKDTIDRDTGRDLSALMQRLYEIKKRFGADDRFFGDADDENDIALLRRSGFERCFAGIFSLKGKSAVLETDIPDGEYENLIDGERVCVEGGKIACTGEPIIIELPGEVLT